MSRGTGPGGWGSTPPERQPGEAPSVRPLGVLSLGETGQRYRLRRQELLDLSGAIPEADRPPLAAYLRGGAIIFAAMEWTRDVIGEAFGTPGGSGIRTDGTFYWRRDAADYVEHYGVALPADFLEHARRLNWTQPTLTPERVLEIDRDLMRRLHGR